MHDLFFDDRFRRINRNNARVERKTDINDVRQVAYISVFYQIPREQVKDLEPCPHCFSELVLLGCEVDSEENVKKNRICYCL